MSSGSGNQRTVAQTSQNLSGWAEPVAKDVISTLLNYIQPGTTVPNNWFGTSGFSFPVGGGGSSLNASQQQAQQNIANSPLQSVLNDPIQNQMLSPMISGSGFLQNLAANNPAAIYGAISPAASQQLGSLYGPSSTAGLNWIPNFNPSGPGYTGTNNQQTASQAWPYSTGGGGSKPG